MIKVTKPGKPVIIVYSNPNTLIRYLALPFRFLLKIIRLLKNQKANESEMYFFAYPIKWWDRFCDVADIQILPWRSFSSNYQKILIPNNPLGKKMLDFLFKLEEQFPNFFVKHFQYPMIILHKKKAIIEGVAQKL
jgi:hypothetical protein